MARWFEDESFQQTGGAYFWDGRDQYIKITENGLFEVGRFDVIFREPDRPLSQIQYRDINEALSSAFSQYEITQIDKMGAEMIPNTTSLSENRYIKGFKDLPDIPGKKDILDAIDRVSRLQKQLEATLKELESIRRELKEAKESNYQPLQDSLEVLQKHTSNLKDRLNEIKKHIIEGCKNAVALFKEKGFVVLNNIVNFTRIKPMLETMNQDVSNAIKVQDKILETIEKVSNEYHQAGMHLKNMGRAITGKEALQEEKSMGKLAQAIQAPAKANRASLVTVKKGIEAVMRPLILLEERNRNLTDVQKSEQSQGNTHHEEKTNKSLSSPEWSQWSQEQREAERKRVYGLVRNYQEAIVFHPTKGYYIGNYDNERRSIGRNSVFYDSYKDAEKALKTRSYVSSFEQEKREKEDAGKTRLADIKAYGCKSSKTDTREKPIQQAMER